jgi:hypothetical protein
MAETADPTAAAKKAAITRKTNAVKRSTTAKKAAQTRAANSAAATRTAKATATRSRTRAAKEAAEQKDAVRSRVGQAAELAQKSLVVPFGATLVARDRVVAAFDELRSTYSTRKKAEAELRRFERRGANALKPLARDAKKTRERVERELRYGRDRIGKDVRMIVKDLEPVAKNVELVSARVENAVQGGRTAATKATATARERIAALT